MCEWVIVQLLNVNDKLVPRYQVSLLVILRTTNLIFLALKPLIMSQSNGDIETTL